MTRLLPGRPAGTDRYTRAGVVVAILMLASIAQAELRTHCAADTELAPVNAPFLRVMTLNMAHGRADAMNQMLVSEAQTHRNLDAIAALIAATEPHVVGLQEADAPSRWSGNFDHVQYVADRSPMACVAHGINSSSWMSSFGTALLGSTALRFPHSTTFEASWPTTRKGYTVAQVDWQRGDDLHRITLVSVHLDFLRTRVRDRQVATMIRELRMRPGPFVIMGDINSDWSHAAEHLQNLARELGLRAFEPERQDLGTYGRKLNKRLDWILISDELRFRRYEVLPEVVSDHRAIVAEIEIAEDETEE